MATLEQDQSFELSKDLNPIIVKGMMGVVLEIYEPDKTFAVEFPKEDGSNYEFEGKSVFTITIDDTLIDSEVQ
jgi:hypothetical protein